MPSLLMAASDAVPSVYASAFQYPAKKPMARPRAPRPGVIDAQW